MMPATVRLRLGELRKGISREREICARVMMEISRGSGHASGRREARSLNDGSVRGGESTR
eukprot:3737279-Rhodomonas_salina.1